MDEPAAIADLIVEDPIETGPDGLSLHVGGVVVPLLMLGERVKQFLPGWRAALLYTGFAPLFLLELVHEDGGEATWFLDFCMQRVCDQVDRLGAELTDLMRQKAALVLTGLLDGILGDCDPALGVHSRAFLRLNPATRHAIGLACVDLLLRRPSRMPVEQLMPSSLMFARPGGRLCAISRDHLAAGLRPDWQGRLPEAFRSRVLAWPSPVDGAVLHAQGCLCIDDFHFAYRFADRRHGLVFFVIIADHTSQVGGVWLPSLGLMVTGMVEGAAGVAHYQVLPHLAHWMVLHICRWASLLVPYLNSGPNRFASVMRGAGGLHIGHQLWNELSGIDHLLASAPDLAAEAALPQWIVLDAAEEVELYGPIETLFPALRGRVDRSLSGVPSLIRHVYEQGLMVLRVTHAHVSARLRLRILDPVRAGAAMRQARLAIAGRGPVILLGLRVENRTLTDLGGFLERLVGVVVDRFPGAIIVLDGHNTRGDGSTGRIITSHGESRAVRRPVEVEHELALRLRQHFAGQPVGIADTIGQPLGVSLAWADQCDCFVSIWGASLAKYRWVCNRPGLVITSRYNLEHRGDLHIYDAPAHMEAPTRLRFTDPSWITDRPEMPLLVDVAPGQASFRNFEVDEARLMAQIAEMIREEWMPMAQP